MIQIELVYNKDGMMTAFHVHGHSGTQKRGRDIVCAGISALSQTAVLGIGKHLHRNVDLKIDPSGDLRLKLNDAPDDLTQAILETMRLGFAEISKANPNAVSVETLRG